MLIGGGGRAILSILDHEEGEEPRRTQVPSLGTRMGWGCMQLDENLQSGPRGDRVGDRGVVSELSLLDPGGSLLAGARKPWAGARQPSAAIKGAGDKVLTRG